MKHLPSILLSLLLGVCLTLYGPSGVVKADGASFLVEICGDGEVVSILIDVDGNPVEPSQNCPECLACCHVAVFQTPAICRAAIYTVLMTIAADQSMAKHTIPNKRNILPAPRGPPVSQVSQQFLPNPIGFAPANIGDTPRSDGRPLLKDANA